MAPARASCRGEPTPISAPPVEFHPFPEVPRDAVDTAQRIARAAKLDVGGIEYLETVDGRRVFYDINANSNLRPSVAEAFSFDPFERVVDFLAGQLATLNHNLAGDHAWHGVAGRGKSNKRSKNPGQAAPPVDARTRIGVNIPLPSYTIWEYDMNLNPSLRWVAVAAFVLASLPSILFAQPGAFGGGYGPALRAVPPPRAFTTSDEHYRYLLEQAKGGTKHTIASVPRWDGLWVTAGNTHMDIFIDPPGFTGKVRQACSRRRTKRPTGSAGGSSRSWAKSSTTV